MTTTTKAPGKGVPKKSATDVQAVVKPTKGQVTFDSEGQEGGPYASRYPHVPSSTSGVTIGRGYDMKNRSGNQIIADLTAAGVALEDAKKLGGAAAKSGAAAKKFLTDRQLENLSISPLAQAKLFDIAYQQEEKEAKRICTKADVQATYGKCDWEHLNPAIQEMVVDLKFRGDYTPATRKLLQKSIASNDLAEFTKLMTSRKNWQTVPKDRFNRRVEFLQKASVS